MRRHLVAVLFLLACGFVAVLSESHTTKPSPLASPAPRELTPEEATTLPPTTALRTTTTHTSRSRPSRTQTTRAGGGWEALRQCENGGSYTGTGRFFGAYQFDSGTWKGVQENHPEIGSWGSASPDQQDAAAQYLYAQRGSAPWPACGKHLR